MASTGPTNARIADLLDEVASLLAAQDANPFRTRAWQDGARAVRDHRAPMAEVLAAGGREALEALPHIGAGLASAIEEIVHTGRLGQLERLRGKVSPEDVFTSIPGIGAALARRIYEQLGVDTLEALELAAHDGRLEQVEGMGPRRAKAVRDVLSGRLSRSARRRQQGLVAGGTTGPAAPEVPLLLAIDEAYREAAGAGRLRRIAPKRFNPQGEAWLPVMHDHRDGFDVTAMFSNTARAHELGKTRDWVVIYFDRGGGEGQCTVVTETRGPLAGRRVIRGRERDCRAYYGASEGSEAPR